ncbi:unnamed protein product, partial [Ectocarpus sp. 12 AP-2014]
MERGLALHPRRRPPGSPGRRSGTFTFGNGDRLAAAIDEGSRGEASGRTSWAPGAGSQIVWLGEGVQGTCSGSTLCKEGVASTRVPIVWRYCCGCSCRGERVPPALM